MNSPSISAIKPRHAEAALRQFARGFPVVVISGPRQSGKTTLARQLFADRDYVSLENPDTAAFALDDPRGFLDRYDQGAIIDEVGRAPQLFSYLQQRVDENPQPGRFILTGSQQFGLAAGISQSLAGRAATLELLPFNYAECYDGEAQPSLDEAVFSGLYPAVHQRGLDPSLWYGQYTRTYVERDVRQLLAIRDLREFQRFVRLCAGRVGQLLNLANLSNACGVSHQTVRSWISVLQASYLIFLLEPHHENFNKRLVKTPKLYFHDTGLACWLLGIRSAEQLISHHGRGALVENWVVSEYFKAACNRGEAPRLAFWRNQHGDEVDLILETPEGLRPIEIKSGKTVHPDHFKALLRWQKLAGDRCVDPTLVYGGDEERMQRGCMLRGWRRGVG